MNLFRSEEHVRRWALFDEISADAIMPVADWAHVFSGPLARNRLALDFLQHIGDYKADLFERLRKLGKTGSFWQTT
jgi:hypothetical protein